MLCGVGGGSYNVADICQKHILKVQPLRRVFEYLAKLYLTIFKSLHFQFIFYLYNAHRYRILIFVHIIIFNCFLADLANKEFFGLRTSFFAKKDSAIMGQGTYINQLR